MTQQDHNYQMDYVEFPAIDIEATKRFYSAVFGWSFTDYGPNYTSFHDGRLAGGFTMSAKPVTRWSADCPLRESTGRDATEGSRSRRKNPDRAVRVSWRTPLSLR